jgi:cobalt-zinc-cadmium efflux system protein
LKKAKDNTMREKKIFWIIIFNCVIVVSEILFGVVSNSFALIADALHNAGDILAIVITYIALKFGLRQTTFKYTFGFLKAEMMAAFINTLFLFIAMIYMIYEAIGRFFSPEIIEPMYMIIVGTIAVIANGVSAYILNDIGVSSCVAGEHSHNHNHHYEDANIRSAYLHMLGDALISVGVVLAGIFIYFFKIYYIDSILTIIFSIYIINHSYPLLKKSFLSLMDANIVDISQEKLEKIIKSDDKILEYHDLHIHSPSSKHNFISFHIVLSDDNLSLKQSEEITSNIKHKLEDLGFNHILIQIDTDKYLKNKISCPLMDKS